MMFGTQEIKQGKDILESTKLLKYHIPAVDYAYPGAAYKSAIDLVNWIID